MDRRRWLLAIGSGLAMTLLMLILGSAWRPPTGDALLDPDPTAAVGAEPHDPPRVAKEGEAEALRAAKVLRGDEARVKLQAQEPSR